MSSAFLSQALRQQAAQEARGQMMKDAIARQVSNQIMGQIAQGEINALKAWPSHNSMSGVQSSGLSGN